MTPMWLYFLDFAIEGWVMWQHKLEMNFEFTLAKKAHINDMSTFINDQNLILLYHSLFLSIKFYIGDSDVIIFSRFWHWRGSDVATPVGHEFRLLYQSLVFILINSYIDNPNVVLFCRFRQWRRSNVAKRVGHEFRFGISEKNQKIIIVMAFIALYFCINVYFQIISILVTSTCFSISTLEGEWCGNTGWPRISTFVQQSIFISKFLHWWPQRDFFLDFDTKRGVMWQHELTINFDLALAKEKQKRNNFNQISI